MGFAQTRREQARAFAREHGLEDQVLVADQQLAAPAPRGRRLPAARNQSSQASSGMSGSRASASTESFWLLRTRLQDT